ncbi:amino acid ABC transporter ATP-binding/permease protein [Selenomonas ruminantium]|uniref:amino acid ABC transporter ATP-binding/permease protein n=1 Tax=Selenomonas ruminantium TaxID=971 RepID=UPI00047AB941|nr:ATP-binding cassette domain-containing protein [Selenomonas ruminantium]
MLRKIFSLLHPGEICLLLSLSLFALLANLGLLGSAAWLISSASLLPPLYALTLGITAVRALGIGRALLRYGERYFTHKTAFAVLGSLRLRLYDVINAQANIPQAGHTQGTILNDLLTKADILRDFLLRGLISPVAICLATLLTTALLMPLLSYYVLVLPVLCLCHCLSLWLSPSNAEHSSHYRSQLLDFAQGSHEMQMAGSLDIAARKLDHSATRWQKQLLSDNRQSDRIDLLLSLLRFTSFVFLFTLLIAKVNQNLLSGNTMSLWVLVLLALFNELSALPSALRQFRQAQAAADWLQEKPLTAERTLTAASTAADLLTVSALTFSYPQSLPIFSGLTFSVAPGCHTAIIGDSGSGKTTLAYLLAGLWQPTAGSIHYADSSLPPVCAIPQGSFLFSGSIRENFLRLHPGIHEDDMHKALQCAQLNTVISQLPQGIDTPLGENACFLSGGERNRLASALILASSAPILLFDEPTAGLDKSTADQLLTAIIDKSNLTSQTVLLITHDLPQLHRFEQVIRLGP